MFAKTLVPRFLILTAYIDPFATGIVQSVEQDSQIGCQCFCKIDDHAVLDDLR